MTTGGHTADVRGAEASRALPTAVRAVPAVPAAQAAPAVPVATEAPVLPAAMAVHGAGAATAAVPTVAAPPEAVPTAAVPPRAEVHTVEEARMAAVAAAVEVAGEAGR